jgi:uncharacterized membrane protein YeaQ/YmgE (transglycosylase-associated protein family)
MIGPVLGDAVGFEGGTAAAEIAGTFTDEGGIEWLQVLLGALAGALIGAAVVLIVWRRSARS